MDRAGAGARTHRGQIVGGDGSERGPTDGGEHGEDAVEAEPVRSDQAMGEQVEPQVGVADVLGCCGQVFDVHSACGHDNASKLVVTFESDHRSVEGRVRWWRAEVRSGEEQVERFAGGGRGRGERITPGAGRHHAWRCSVRAGVGVTMRRRLGSRTTARCHAPAGTIAAWPGDNVTDLSPFASSSMNSASPDRRKRSSSPTGWRSHQVQVVV